jgi:hypothetical protein
MKLQDLYEFYKYNWYLAARDLKKSYTTINNWRKREGIPYAAQAEIETHTKGKLKAKIEDCGTYKIPAGAE